MTNKSKVLLGILGAAAAGVVIGLLIAPEKGKDMRKKLRKTVGEWTDELGNLWTKTKDGMEEKVREARSTAQEKSGKIKINEQEMKNLTKGQGGGDVGF